MLLQGDVAKLVLEHLLANVEGENNYLGFPYAGYFKKGEHYICFDNTCHSCWVEQTRDKGKAIKWCLKEIESAELYFS